MMDISMSFDISDALTHKDRYVGYVLPCLNQKVSNIILGLKRKNYNLWMNYLTNEDWDDV